MANLTKNQKVNASKVEVGSKYSISDALGLIKECATAKFDASEIEYLKPTSTLEAFTF